ncbi:MAG: PEP-CTERM sorting domain-containing protein [Chthoniobacterales bacterium]
MKKFLLTSTALCIVAITSNLNAALIAETYSSPTSGTVDWSAATWSPTVSGGPNNGANTYDATITHSTSDNLILNTSSDITIQGLALSASSGSMNFNLGGNFTVASGSTGITTNITNTTGSASNLVIDLNGHTLDLSHSGQVGTVATNTNFTINSSSAGGIFKIPTQSYTGAPSWVFGNNVTQQITGSSTYIYTYNETFAANATLQIASAATNGEWETLSTGAGPNKIGGNAIIGDGTTSNTVLLYAEGVASISTLNRLNTVNGNFTITANSNIAMGGYLSSSQGIVGMKVGGNFTDNNTTTGTYNSNLSFGAGYPNSTAGVNTVIYLNGGAGTEHLLTINRTLAASTQGGITTFQVGDGTTAGNIKLGHDFNTAGTFTVLKGSRFNLGNYTLTTGGNQAAGSGNNAGWSVAQNSLTIQAGVGGVNPTLAYTFGNAGTGLLNSTAGTVSLNTFNLELNYDASGWTTGNILLVQYAGTLTGTPTIGTLTFNGGTFTYGALDTSTAGKIYLDNVALVPVPEPGAVLLIGAFGGLVVWTVRRKNRKA